VSIVLDRHTHCSLSIAVQFVRISTLHGVFIKALTFTENISSDSFVCIAAIWGTMNKQAQQSRLNHRYLCPWILVTASHRQLTSSVAILITQSLVLIFSPRSTYGIYRCSWINIYMMREKSLCICTRKVLHCAGSAKMCCTIYR
jgi:hypothetical protein